MDKRKGKLCPLRNAITALLTAFINNSLVATIKQARPTLLSDFNEGLATPIPALPPPEYLAQFQKTNIVDIGEPITATVLTRTDIDPTKWYACKKNFFSKPVLTQVDV